MTAKILPFKQKKWEPVLDAKGRPMRGFHRLKSTGVIYYRESFKKLKIPRLQVSTEEITIGKAKTKADILIHQHKNRHLGIDDSHVFRGIVVNPFKKIAEHVLKYHTPKMRKGTRINHNIYIPQLVEEFGEFEVNSITVERFEKYIDRLRKSKERKTFMDYAKYMNLVMRYAYKLKKCRHLVIFANPDTSKTKPGRVYTKKEIKHLWQVMNTDTRDQFTLCFECYMRLREALYLDWDRVDLNTGKITLRVEDVKTGTKTGRGREFIMSPYALKRLKARYKVRNPRSKYVFPSPKDEKKPVVNNKRAWATAKERAGLARPNKARWHDLRHTALTIALLEKRLNPTAVSEYAGVSLKTIQSVYLHSTAELTKDISGAFSIKNGEEE